MAESTDATPLISRLHSFLFYNPLKTLKFFYQIPIRLRYKNIFTFDIVNMGKKGKKERRRAERVNLDYALVDVYPERVLSEEEFRGKICDISSTGIKFTSFRPYDVGSILFLKLLLPSHGSLIDIPGKVVRCEEKVPDEAFFVSVEFEEDYYQESLINDYIKLMKRRDRHINVDTEDAEFTK